jgi:hypothetical protein
MITLIIDSSGGNHKRTTPAPPPAGSASRWLRLPLVRAKRSNKAFFERVLLSQREGERLSGC